MAEISIGDAVGAGFDLVRRRPVSVMVWGGVAISFAVARFALLWPMVSASIIRITQGRLGAPMAPSEMAGVMEFQTLSYLTSFVQMFVMVVVYCAAFRAIIHPDQKQWAGLRLGMTELLLSLLIVAGYIAAVIALVIVAIPFVLLAVALGAAHAEVGVVIVAIIAGVLAAWALVYGALRLSMVGPMMVEDGKVHVVDAWALTRGKAAPLFGVGLILLVITLVGEVVIFAVLGALGLGALAAMAGSLQSIPGLFRQPAPAVIAELAPLAGVLAVLMIPVYGVLSAVWAAPWARAYLDLRHSPVEAF